MKNKIILEKFSIIPEHHTHDISYINLQQRLNKFPQSAPASNALYKILKLLFSRKEATLVSLLPIKPFTSEIAAKIWKCSVHKSLEILNTLADKGVILDIDNGNERTFMLAPPMAGFFEFTIMRTDGKFDQQILSELYYEYINVEDKFITNLFNLKPPIDRVFIYEDQIPEQIYFEILDFERISHIIETASCITVGQCYCRHKMELIGKGCNNPQDVCLTFNTAAKSLSKHGIAKQIEKTEAYDIIERVQKLGLVQIGDNVQNQVNWICNCCGCCCEALLAYKRLNYNQNIQSNFHAEINKDSCISCGLCIKKCPVDAISFKHTSSDEKKALINNYRCIGCGVCSRFCQSKAIVMKRRSELQPTPKDGFERIILSAIDSGTLQNLIFDNFNLWTQRIFRSFIGIILKLSPVRKLLFDKQIQSRYLEWARNITNYKE